MLAVVDHRAVAFPADMVERPRDDLLQRVGRGRFRRHEHRAAAGELRQARPLHAAARQRIAEVVRPRMHDRAVTDVDAVVHVSHRRAGKPSFHPQAIATCHLSEVSLFLLLRGWGDVGSPRR